MLATDIFDPELNDLRKKRWAQAFSTESNSNANVNDARATVVIEHIMQASDVCHTMQHWHIYQRFNKKLFEELLVAFKAGRCASSPADFWYEGELKFFDNYIIPLAQKLKDCNIFGVSSDECLNFAVSECWVFVLFCRVLGVECRVLGVVGVPLSFCFVHENSLLNKSFATRDNIFALKRNAQLRNRMEWEDRGRKYCQNVAAPFFFGVGAK